MTTNDDDSATGFDRPPSRYMGTGRETVDRMRDFCREEAFNVHREVHTQSTFDKDDDSYLAHLGDLIFAIACRTHEMKYRDRAGRKGGEEKREEDLGKATWWSMMTFHAVGEGADPRHERDGFVPYAQAPVLRLAQSPPEPVGGWGTRGPEVVEDENTEDDDCIGDQEALRDILLQVEARIVVDRYRRGTGDHRPLRGGLESWESEFRAAAGAAMLETRPYDLRELLLVVAARSIQMVDRLDNDVEGE